MIHETIHNVVDTKNGSDDMQNGSSDTNSVWFMYNFRMLLNNARVFIWISLVGSKII